LSRGTDRGTAITIVTVIFYIFGVVEIATGLSILALANIASSIFFYTGVIAGVTMALGVGIIIIGAVDFLAGRWLWNAKRKGGILGLLTAAVGVILNAIFVPVEPMPSISGIMLSIIVITLIAIGWKKLQ
jgi:hypothetical protein